MNNILMVEIPQVVKIRKHQIDIKELQNLLRDNKKLSNIKIAQMLNIPKTKVDHWFRTDSCFAIPDEENWEELKELLNIKTNKFDAYITEFEYRFGKYDMSNRFYLSSGIAPTLTCGSLNQKFVIGDVL